MTDHELIQQAGQLRLGAEELLYTEGLFNLLQDTGNVYVMGSVVLDLMTWPDIDIDVQLADAQDVRTFFQLGCRIATVFSVPKMSFSNIAFRPEVPFPDGLYWNIRLDGPSYIWKIDLWGYEQAVYQKSVDEFEALRERLQTADRLTILRIKQALCRQDGYGKTVTSMDIYQSVLHENVTSVEEFDIWYQNVRRDSR